MDPYPFKHPAVLLARVRDLLEPTFLGAGFRFESRNDPRVDRGPRHLWIDYSRGEEVISLRLDFRQAILSLSVIDQAGNVRQIAGTSFEDCPINEITERVDQFVENVRQSEFFTRSPGQPDDER
jgi:hypothetical protein